MPFQIDELKQAAKDHRQPICLSCGQPLDEIIWEPPKYDAWTWDAEAGRYKRGHYVWMDADQDAHPYHGLCGAKDPELLDNSKEHKALGLIYDNEETDGRE